MLCAFLLLLVAIWTAYIEEASLIKSEVFFNIMGDGHQTKSRCVVVVLNYTCFFEYQKGAYEQSDPQS